MANSIKVSLICTIKNEKQTIRDLLESMGKQTRLPDEIIIVDGGSTDGTTEIIREYMKTLPIKLIISCEANIAKGRNIAIKNATYSIIASTDGGCKLDQKWFQNIVSPLEESDSDVVCGVYAPWYESEFEEIASYLIFPSIKKLNPKTFLPSGRSVAFTKKAWEVAGGYPEWLSTAEDTLFDLKLRESGMRFTLATNAIVYWRVRHNTKQIFKQYYYYAKGEGVEFLFPKYYLPRYLLASISLFLAIEFWYDGQFWLLLISLLLVGFWIKHLRKVKKSSIKRILCALRIASTIEVALIFGYSSGILTRIRKSISSGDSPIRKI
jgi:glycosyltransferase involved in cell wall biosynthesis